MNKPKIKNSNHLENYLWEGEEILWQGRPNAPLWEYLQKKPVLVDVAIVGGGEQVASRADRVNRKILANTRFLWIGFSTVVSLFVCGAFTKFAFPLSGGDVFVVSYLLCILVFFVVFVLIGLFNGWFNALREKRHVIYALTNRRVCILIPSAWLYLNYDELKEIALEAGQYGTNLIWHHRGLFRVQLSFSPFLGLNDFDLQKILQIVQSHAPHVVGTDHRSK